jgi:hypothetical protein
MPNSFDFPVRSGSSQKKAILFVHGFSGDAQAQTFCAFDTADVRGEFRA